MRLGILVVLLTLAVPDLANAQGRKSERGLDQNSGKPLFAPFGLDLTAIDKRTRPQDDFYQYVNGAWIARTTIPAGKDQVEETGNVMQDRVDARIRALLEAAA